MSPCFLRKSLDLTPVTPGQSEELLQARMDRQVVLTLVKTMPKLKVQTGSGFGLWENPAFQGTKMKLECL